MNFEIHPADVKKMIERGEAVKLIDVREVAEHQICNIEGAELIPMGTIPEQVSRLEEEADNALLVIFCHHGARSMNVVSWLRGNGIENCVSMAGGIDGWSALVDPSVPRY
jgi:rhodanese-related sulfurtransferase